MGKDDSSKEEGNTSTISSKSKGNRLLSDAKKAKKDEFYTQLEDIEKELRYYKDQLRGKIIFCNTDDPYESNFFKYFALNFNALGLKKLIATSYVPSPIAGTELPLFEIEGLKPDGKEPFKIEINAVPDVNQDGATDLVDVELLLRHEKNITTPLQGNGDFRSDECVELLKQADVVVTNPPFSLFREFVAQLIQYKKEFIIIGNVNSITTKDIFGLIMKNKIWLGESIHSGDREFQVPDYYPLEAAGTRIDAEGKKYIRVTGVRWFTNLDVPFRHEKLTLFKKYSSKDYPQYDNFDAIHVSSVKDIPVDYSDTMGVPITFLDKYNPDQFEILGITKTWFGAANKVYPKQVQVNKNGKESTVTKLNDGAVLKVDSPPISKKTYYTVDGDFFIQKYPRILIRAKGGI